MPTSVHIPKPLLEAVDRRARALRLSRNRYIIRALERDLAADQAWSPGFFEQLAQSHPGDARAVNEMLGVIRARRTRKLPPSL